MSRRWLLLALVVSVPVALLATLTVASFAFRTTDGDAVTIPDPVERIVVEGDGDVRLAAADDRRSVLFEWRSRYFVDAPEISWRLDGTTMVIRSDCGGFGWFTNCTADFELQVPGGLEISVATEHGDVRAVGPIGGLRASSQHGDVDVPGTSASVVIASSEHGDVALELGGPVVRVDATTEHGDVDVSLPRNDYRVEAWTEHGDVAVEGIVQDDRAARSVRATSEHGDVTVDGR